MREIFYQGKNLGILAKLQGNFSHSRTESTEVLREYKIHSRGESKEFIEHRRSNFALFVTEFERTVSYRRVRPIPVDDPQTVSGECGSGFYGSGGQAARLPQLIAGQARAQGPQVVSG